MDSYAVGYLVGSLAKASINRQLARALVRLAPEGLTLTEIRGLLHGFPAATAAPSRWRSVRATKLAALDARIRALRAARRHLRASVTCHCADLDECGRRVRAVRRGRGFR